MTLLASLNSSLKTLITKELDNTPLCTVDIKFAPPNKDFQSQVTKPTVNIFLYDIRENLELRTHQSIVVKDNTRTDLAPLQICPKHVSFSYILTAWTKSENNSDIDVILSLLLEKLLYFSELPEKYLDDSINTLKPLPKIQILHPTFLQGIGEFWQALEGQPKPLIHCTITAPIYPDQYYGQLITNVITDINYSQTAK